MYVEETSRKGETSENTVFIGKKPVMNYIVACLTLFNSGADSVVVKARGRAISRAVDTVELLRRAFVKNVKIESVEMGTQEITREDNRKSNVSTMEITLTRSE